MTNCERKKNIWVTVRRELCWLSIPLIFVVLAGLALRIDCALSQWFVQEQWSEKQAGLRGCLQVLRDLLGVFESFGNGLGVAVLMIAFFVLDPERRWALPRLVGCALGAGMAANGFKTLLARTRPYAFDFLGDVWTTFGAWFPGTSAGSAGQSFPSAHTATAVAFAAGLMWLYPRGRWFFFLCALMVGCQRIQSGAHFLSDVLAGAALGSLIALAFLKCGLLPGWFDRLEIKLGRKLP